MPQQTLSLADLLPNYDLFLVRSVSKTTVYSYRSRLRTALRITGIQTVEEFTTDSLRAHLKKMADTQRPRTVDSARSALNKFGEWLVLTGRISVNPVAAIPKPRLDLPRRPMPTDERIADLLSAVQRITPTARQALARAVLMVLVHAGLRRSELLSLTIGDVDFEEGAILIRHGKGDKARSVYPNTDCMDALRAYLAVRPPCKQDRLFLLRKGFVLGDHGLRVLLRQCMAVADMPEDRSLLPHSLRHALATRLYRRGADLIDIGRVLGHSNINTTSIYLHSDAARLKGIRDLSSVGVRNGPSSPGLMADPAQASKTTPVILCRPRKPKGSQKPKAPLIAAEGNQAAHLRTAVALGTPLPTTPTAPLPTTPGSNFASRRRGAWGTDTPPSSRQSGSGQMRGEPRQ